MLVWAGHLELPPRPFAALDTVTLRAGLSLTSLNPGAERGGLIPIKVQARDLIDGWAMKKILVINGHPDGDSSRFSSALTGAYASGADRGGHSIRRINLADLSFPLITERHTFESEPSKEIAEVQHAITWCDHLVVVHPLWLGGPPARLKGLFEQVFRYGFALPKPGSGKGIGGLLKGRSARMIVTMGMPAPIFRLVFGAFGVRAIERGILRLCGFGPIRRTLIGGVESISAEQRAAWLRRIGRLGVEGL